MEQPQTSLEHFVTGVLIREIARAPSLDAVQDAAIALRNVRRLFDTARTGQIAQMTGYEAQQNIGIIGQQALTGTPDQLYAQYLREQRTANALRQQANLNPPQAAVEQPRPRRRAAFRPPQEPLDLEGTPGNTLQEGESYEVPWEDDDDF